jgi:hypothetical protein
VPTPLHGREATAIPILPRRGFGPKNEAECYISDAQRATVLRGIVEGFYQDKTDTDVVFDRQRENLVLRWNVNPRPF